jgi:hypothetical protein
LGTEEEGLEPMGAELTVVLAGAAALAGLGQLASY